MRGLDRETIIIIIVWLIMGCAIAIYVTQGIVNRIDNMGGLLGGIILGFLAGFGPLVLIIIAWASNNEN